ncbi:membrane hypothetical protein [Desulfarculales bacterium]
MFSKIKSKIKEREFIMRYNKFLLYAGSVAAIVGPPVIAEGLAFFGQLALGTANILMAIYNVTINERIQAGLFAYCGICNFWGVARYLYLGLDLLS